MVVVGKVMKRGYYIVVRQGGTALQKVREEGKDALRASGGREGREGEEGGEGSRKGNNTAEIISRLYDKIPHFLLLPRPRDVTVLNLT